MNWQNLHKIKGKGLQISEDPDVRIVILDMEDNEIGVIKNDDVVVSGVLPHFLDDDFHTAIINHLLNAR